MLMKITCPSCGVEGSMSLLEPSYEGPYRCWKCREMSSIVIINNALQSAKPITEEEFEAMQEEQKKQREIDEFKNKFRKG